MGGGLFCCLIFDFLIFKAVFKMPSGGNRIGAGRKPRSEKFARPIASAEKKIADRLPWLIDKEMELAEGVLVEKQTLMGPVVYKTPPDRQAIEYLINRIMGKPTERHEHDIDTEIADLLAVLAPGSQEESA
jgi:hypothetical protein